MITQLSKPVTAYRNIVASPAPGTDKKMSFEVSNLSDFLRERAAQQVNAYRHDCFMVLWVRQGSGVYQIDMNRYEIKADTVYFLAPGQIDVLQASEDLDGYVISFSNEFLNLYENNFDLLFNTGLYYTLPYSPFIKVQGEDMVAELEHMVLKMIKEYRGGHRLRAEVLRGNLKLFLIYLIRQDENAAYSYPTKKFELVKRFLQLLEKDFATKKLVTDYADELAVTPSYLNIIVKKVSGFPASFHIQQRIIMEAKRQAFYADMTMKEIAYDLGFDDIAHFSKYFKNVAGTSFTDFKKEVQTHLCL
ncbi:AraC family transcriptional regulator [Chitinophaga parva]|nr:helix-turn-helix domain-containing protein [Chitinophaga parva]